MIIYDTYARNHINMLAGPCEGNFGRVVHDHLGLSKLGRIYVAARYSSAAETTFQGKSCKLRGIFALVLVYQRVYQHKGYI